MKKAEEYLKDAFEEAKINYPNENWKAWEDIEIEKEFICRAINQARKDALTELKDSLLDDERNEGNEKEAIFICGHFLKLKDECV